MDTIFDQIDSIRQCKSEENLNALHAYLTKIRKMISEMNEAVKQNENFWNPTNCQKWLSISHA